MPRVVTLHKCTRLLSLIHFAHLEDRKSLFALTKIGGLNLNIDSLYEFLQPLLVFIMTETQSSIHVTQHTFSSSVEASLLFFISNTVFVHLSSRPDHKI